MGLHNTMEGKTANFVVLVLFFMTDFMIVTATEDPTATHAPDPPTNSSMAKKDFCTNNTYLDKCWSQLPPIPDTGIPASPQAVDAACKAFDTGMNCVEDWAKKCLGKKGQELVKTSVSGAHETFAFLCRDPRFRAEFLKHAPCYKRISPLWDECARQFVENLKRYPNSDDQVTLCCVRIRFLQCVTEVANLHCSPKAAEFLQRMAETLVRSTMKSHFHLCSSPNFTYKNCTMVSSALPSCKFHSVAAAYSSPKTTAITLDTAFVFIRSFFSSDYLLHASLFGCSALYLAINSKFL